MKTPQPLLPAMYIELLTTCLHEFLIPNFNFYQVLANQDAWSKKYRKIRNWEFVKIWGEQLTLICTTSKLWITLDMLWSFKLSLKAKRASNGLMFLFTVCAICWQNFVENEKWYTSKKANILGPFQEQITFGPFSINFKFFWWIIRNKKQKNMID